MEDNKNPNNGGDNGGSSGEKTFTQAEVDALIAGRLARESKKYADYEDLKAKAEKYDLEQNKGKTELQKATEKAEALQRQLDQITKENTVKQAREKISKETSVPVELLTGEDEESCKKQAEAILKFTKPSNYPGTRTNRENNNPGNDNQVDETLREFTRQLFGGK